MIRGKIQEVIEGVIKRFTASGRPGETITNRECFQHYGFTSRPLEGAEAIIIKEGNHIIMIASDDRRYRIALEEGEVALYTDEGDKIHLKRDRTIEIVSGNKLVATVDNEVDITTKMAVVTASTSCQVNSPLINLGGDRGGLRRFIDDRFVALFNEHVHPGVEAGEGST
ncbi:MAG: phage baseplate assembly protein, partial [Deltaproteobacteria bacterium]|nr:phage baseplate assembly protein [Deltaproteobacteria bacterium]